MKPLIIVCMGVLFLCNQGLTAENPLYQQRIVVSAEASSNVKESAEILKGFLERITGETFEVVQQELAGSAGDEGIVLATGAEVAEDPAFARLAEKLEPRNTEAFVIDAGKVQPGLHIIGATELGVRHGVFRYLQKLGYIALFPGEHWQIVPSLKNIRLDTQEADAPYYLQRSFFGTGGFGSNLPLDKDGEIKKMWDTWWDANLFGQGIRLGGHYGEAFARKYQTEFEAHPEYLPIVKGERIAYNPKGFQLNYGNKDLRKLYVEDRVEALGLLVEKDPNRPYSASVDPADGGGHDESPESVALGSVSNRVFGLANEVAKAVEEKYPGNYVNLYAYNFHADVPDFKLEPNVIVQVIPYGFNRAKNLLGDDLLVAWKEKATSLGLYDYWGIPDWSRGMPNVDYLKSAPHKLKVWTENHVRFVNFESSSGAGTTGIALYLASKYLWNPKIHYEEELNRFYDTAFGKVREPMQRMLERWAGGFNLHDNEIALSYRDLAEALEKAKGDAVLTARVEDYITYVHYLQLLWEMDIAASKSQEKHEAADALCRYLWQIRKNGMVQTFRISQMLTNVWQKSDEDFAATWNYSDETAPGWATVPDYPTSEEIAGYLKKGMEQYTVLYEPKNYEINENELVPLFNPVQTNPDEEDPDDMVKTFPIFKGHTLVFQADREGEVPINLLFGDAGNSTEEAVFIVTRTDDSKVVLNEAIRRNGEWQRFTIPVEKGKNYHVTINGRSSTYHIKTPASLPIVFTSGVLPNGWVPVKLWFYVPKGTKRFAFHAIGNPVMETNTKVGVDDDFVIEPMLAKNGYMVFEVPSGDDGKVWFVEKYTSSWGAKLYNVPFLFSYRKENLMLPKDLVKEAQK